MENNEPYSWTAVDERVAVAPLGRLSGSSNLIIVLSLPKLHPGFEQDSCHSFAKPLDRRLSYIEG
jgi:hypothetical protein